MLTFLLAVMVILFAGPNPREIDPEILPYVERFEEKCHCKVDMVIKFNNMSGFPEGTAGVCNVFFGPNRRVYLTKKYWQYYTDQNKQQLVFHELGHCILNRDHDTTRMKGYYSQYPNSYMAPVMFDYPTELEEHYIQELFKNH